MTSIFLIMFGNFARICEGGYFCGCQGFVLRLFKIIFHDVSVLSDTQISNWRIYSDFVEIVYQFGDILCLIRVGLINLSYLLRI